MAITRWRQASTTKTGLSTVSMSRLEHMSITVEANFYDHDKYERDVYE